MSKRQRSELTLDDDNKSTQTVTVSISQLIEDCKIIPYDGGNNTTKLQIELPHYFYLISPSMQQRVIDTISSLSIE